MAKRNASLRILAFAIGLVGAHAACADVWQPLEQWRIADGVVAPWAQRGTQIDAAYRGREVRFETTRLVAPQPLACGETTYEWLFGEAEGLFEGNLPAPAATAARRLGLGPEPIATLRIGCPNAGFDFHRTEGGDLLLGLDNVVWTLRPARAASTPTEIVQELLIVHFTHDMGFTRASVALKNAFLSADLRARMERYLAAPQSPDEAPAIDGDPFTDTQEYPDRFTLGGVRTEGSRTIVPANFTIVDAKRRVDYVLVSEGNRWVVDDVLDERGQSVRELLGATTAEPVVQPAIDGILAAFETHPLVGLGEYHELANLLTFYAALVRDPRFAPAVGNVVVEFGASQHQDILDRYLGGEDVPHAELSKVWRNTVAWDPSVGGIGYQTFFAQVRAVNLALPASQRIRVWLSEPPIDWSAIRTQQEWQAIYDQRDPHAAAFIAREILERGKKALVIYGSGHFFSFPWPSTLPVPAGGTATLGEIVEREHPGAFFLVSVYGGYAKPGCSEALEAAMQWPKASLISPIRGTSVENAVMRAECRTDALRGVEPLPPAEEVAQLLKRFQEIETGVAGDALLYLAPLAELMTAPSDPALWMDVDYFNEIARRAPLRGSVALPFAELLPLVASSPRRWRPQ